MDVKAIRQGSHVTQQFMADVLGISISYYRKIEKGDKPLTSELKAKIEQSFF